MFSAYLYYFLIPTSLVPYHLKLTLLCFVLFMPTCYLSILHFLPHGIILWVHSSTIVFWIFYTCIIYTFNFPLHLFFHSFIITRFRLSVPSSPCYISIPSKMKYTVAVLKTVCDILQMGILCFSAACLEALKWESRGLWLWPADG